MKKVLKILLVCALALVTALGMIACNNGGGGSGSKKGVSGSVIDGVYEVRKYYAEDGVTELDLGAFFNSLELPENIKEIKIKANAFSGNNTLKKVIVPTNTKEIAAGAFAKMQALETLELPYVGLNFNSDPTYNNSDNAENKAVDSTRTIAHLFGTEEYDNGSAVTVNYGSSTTTVYMPMTLKNIVINNEKTQAYNIPMYAFYGVTLFENITLEGNIVGIGEYAFSGVGGIETLTLPATVATIYKGAFSASLIKNVILSASEIEVKEEAFKGCSLLNYVGAGAAESYVLDLTNINTIGSSAFDLSDNELKYKVKGLDKIDDIEKIFGETEVEEYVAANA